jgi:hypothetical protein
MRALHYVGLLYLGLGAAARCPRLLLPEMGLILKRAKFSRSSGEWKDEAMTCSPTARWWGASMNRRARASTNRTTLVLVDYRHRPLKRGVMNGHVTTREEAMAKFRAAWRRLAAAEAEIKHLYAQRPCALTCPNWPVSSA